MMTYKGFVGEVEYDDEARIFSGEVINTRTVITFQGTTVDEVENEFHASVDDYLEWCKEDGIEPEKPYSGKFNVRLSPLFHSKVAMAAKKLNTLYQYQQPGIAFLLRLLLLSIQYQCLKLDCLSVCF